MDPFQLWREIELPYNRRVLQFESILRELNRAEVRFVVVGGLATVLHGHARFTADVDLIVDLAPEPARKLVQSLQALGLEPRLPVKGEDFCNPQIRRRWIEKKGMQVFSFWDPGDPRCTVDLFVHNPIDFEELWSQSELVKLESTSVRIASIPHLIQLKKRAGRALDLDDVKQLERIQRRVKEKQ